MPTLLPDGLVLGIDAAWTARNPSGVALVARTDGVWRLVAAASSVPDFLAATDCDGAAGFSGLIDAARCLAGRVPDVVAVDMPMMDAPITARRTSDNAVTSAYSGRGAGTHSPTPDRPGAVGRALEAALAGAGYPLATTTLHPPCRIEIYPHPALIELMAAPYRLEYKAGKTGKYWPGLPLPERKARLFAVWAEIVAALDGVIAGSAAALVLPPPEARGATLKAFEDKLDAVVAAYAGAMALDGRAVAYGDALSAVWVPVGRNDNGRA